MSQPVAPSGKPLLVHIGYHKTASTWMQKLLFLPEYGYQQIAGHGEVARFIINSHALFFDADAASDMIKQRLANADPENVPVISSEMLSGNPLLGGVGSVEFADRLREIVPDARILISIRDQMTILPSVYLQYLLRGGTMTPKQFFQRRDDYDLGFGYFPYCFSPEHFEYDRLVKYYQDAFGPERVFVLAQEQLGSDVDQAMSDLAAFCENTKFTSLGPEARKRRAASYPEYAIPFLRRINHVQRGTFNANPVVRLGTTPGGLYRGVGYILKRSPMKDLLGKHKPASDFVRSHFAGHYDESNRRLDDILKSQPGWSGLPWGS